MQKFRVYKGQELSFTITANSFDAVKEFMTSHGQDHSEFTIKTDLEIDFNKMLDDMVLSKRKWYVDDYGSTYLRIDIHNKVITAHDLQFYERVAHNYIENAFVAIDMNNNELVIKLTNNK